MPTTCYTGASRVGPPNLNGVMAPPAVLSIAGSDSGGGAGIQADLKAFARCGVHGMTAITALTAQSTVGVTAVHPVPPEFIIEQVRTVALDIGVDAIKIGMLGTAETVRAVREAIEPLAGVPVVIDPVMVAESGAVLLDDEARAAIVTELLPLATVITPTLPEARVLAGGDPRGPRAADDARAAAETRAARAGDDTRPPAGPRPLRAAGAAGAAAAPREPRAADAPNAHAAAQGAGALRDARGRAVPTLAGRDAGDDDVADLARALYELGPANVVITGGHRDVITDVFFDGARIHLIPGERHPDGAAHGSGCTHSSALAARLALGFSPLEAAQRAKVIASEAVLDGLREIGQGAGPVNALGMLVSHLTDRHLGATDPSGRFSPRDIMRP